MLGDPGPTQVRGVAISPDRKMTTKADMAPLRQGESVIRDVHWGGIVAASKMPEAALLARLRVEDRRGQGGEH